MSNSTEGAALLSARVVGRDPVRAGKFYSLTLKTESGETIVLKSSSGSFITATRIALSDFEGNLPDRKTGREKYYERSKLSPG